MHRGCIAKMHPGCIQMHDDASSRCIANPREMHRADASECMKDALGDTARMHRNPGEMHRRCIRIHRGYNGIRRKRRPKDAWVDEDNSAGRGGCVQKNKTPSGQSTHEGREERTHYLLLSTSATYKDETHVAREAPSASVAAHRDR